MIDVLGQNFNPISVVSSIKRRGKVANPVLKTLRILRVRVGNFFEATDKVRLTQH
jgi:hypothetical protein